MIRVLIADDSAFMRMVLSNLFNKQPDFEVLDTAQNGKEAFEKTLKLKPDLVTMDINMPVMDGLEALAHIMKDCPTAVVMCSSLTKEGADATLKALSIGAVDFINKSGGSIMRIDNIEEEILSKCRGAANARIPGAVRRVITPTAAANPAPTGEHRKRDLSSFTTMAKPSFITSWQKPMQEETSSRSASNLVSSGGKNKLVVLGTSTGGPKALQSVVPMLPKNLPCGVLIVQHMPPGFTKSLAERLDELSEISVQEAKNHDLIEPGHVYIAPGNYHMVVAQGTKGREVELNQEPPLGTLRPAADVLFKSVASLGPDIVSVILTGMGQDGAVGMQNIKKHGGYIIAEAESTCVVYGMPKAVVDLGIADEVLPLQKVAAAIVKAVGH